MKTIIAILAVFGILLVFGLWACEPMPQDESDQEKAVVTDGYNSEVYAKKVSIDNHEYYLVYATCNGKPGHTLKHCGDAHCFLHHSPSCKCLKDRPHESLVVTDDDEIESTDPFDW